jgi:hypothetical protein
MADSKWVFGLAVDEDARWGLAKVSSGAGDDPPIFGSFGTLPHDCDDLEQRLKGFLSSLAIKYAEHFHAVEAIGVSTIGLADQDSLRLTSVARKRWKSTRKAGQPPYVIDFASLFRGLFPKIPKIDDTKIRIHNDATARCVAEYRRNTDARCRTLAMVVFSEGVNTGIAVNGSPMHGQLHCEMGHIWPRLHKRDYEKFQREHTGCPTHIYCFEGVASGVRIRKSWGAGLKHCLDHEDRPWEIIGYYIAQLCIDVTLTVFPDRVLLGGDQPFPEILPYVYKYFDLFNSGGRGSTPYLRYPAMTKLDTFIRMARLDYGNQTVYGALELARQKAFRFRDP